MTRTNTVNIMDIETGKLLDEFGQFAEEVLNASGLPLALVEQLGLQQAVAVRSRASVPVADPERFLAEIYRNQE